MRPAHSAREIFVQVHRKLQPGRASMRPAHSAREIAWGATDDEATEAVLQ